ncbi:zinc finger CCCH domain-containing protein 7A [Hyla sarda]|uniref:zinc finger CCCH domain-containing protein 7A n=1 Tax=Hyla sarda TaxID=327740 RepID=UPI0024C32BB2|nr:zinc finger CCCH domain-containing protein 7A [Hyla sarda]XP_056393114.1 zinc finger CCCH domain-containing protein 7A [Hyla sarda]XP_056393115.1 zinc finger CCCH domain-containing protein 7A [Hyla sarda]
MSHVSSDRRSRQEDIKSGMEFIQSPLPFPGSQEDYEIFIHKLVRNLFNEGNDLYREALKDEAINQYTEALSIATYAASEEIAIKSETLEKLHVNRALCYIDTGFHEDALRDCEDVIRINEKNLRALYCKSKALFTLERYKEAYEAIAKCSIIAPKDESVVKLTRELAVKLGLKIRKAYVRTQPNSQVTAVDPSEKMCDSFADQIEPDLPEFDGHEPLYVPFSTLSLNNGPFRETSPVPAPSVSPSVPLVSETGIFPSALISSDTSALFPLSNLRDEIIGDELDLILDSVPSCNGLNMASSAVRGTSRLTDFPGLEPPLPYQGFAFPQMLSHSMDSFPLNPLPMTSSQRDVSVLDHFNGIPKASLLDPTPFPGNDSTYFLRSDSPLDFSGAHKKGHLLEGVNGEPSIVTSINNSGKIANPLEDTHEFRQACLQCFTKAGLKPLSYNFHPNLDHKCKKDIFIGKLKSSADDTWKSIRPRPTKNHYAGQYYICKDVAQGIECTYPGCCTFAYCQEEIDVWTLERKGMFCREAMFGGNIKVNLTIPHLLQEYSGMFVFLCEKCFDHKPRIISEKNKDNPFSCSHPVAKHHFEENKCLVHMFRDSVVKYCKIRPFSHHVVLDLCRHEVRYGCLRDDDCFYAHSLVELRVWVIQEKTGISFERIVQESESYWAKESSSLKPQLLTVNNNPGYPNFNIKFVCGQCWRNGQVIESDKNRKYCSAKARHTWTKDRQVVLVMSNERKKWISIRPCPTKKPVPVQFELCHHILNGKKCQYIGNCAFAHSQEEKEIWTFMKDLGIQDMEQLYEKLNSKKMAKGNEVSSQVNKQIHLPTDYAETTVDFHCWLCGKNCNSERQWKMHISSEKHKEKVFHSEDDQNIWQHRFPTGCFSICKRFLSGTCVNGDQCDYAHGNAELLEWEERSKVLRLKLEKARKDQLINPDDNDFGKYSFLIKDLK